MFFWVQLNAQHSPIKVVPVLSGNHSPLSPGWLWLRPIAICRMPTACQLRGGAWRLLACPRTMKEFSIGERLAGTYQVCGLIGRGGMSLVFEAEDLALRRRVAIKFNIDDDDGVDLRREAQ